MRLSHRFIFCAALLLSAGATGTLHAQQPSWLEEQLQKVEQSGTAMLVKSRLDKINEELKLTDTQKEKVNTLLMDCAGKLKALLPKLQSDAESARKEGAQIIQQTDQEVEKLLDKVQKPKYEKLKKELPALM